MCRCLTLTDSPGPQPSKLYLSPTNLPLKIPACKGHSLVGAHYFEEGNVQLDAKHECKDSTIFQVPMFTALGLRVRFLKVVI
ncbi:F-actin-capping protein subunit alpha [Camellia lanceoleosa]|uniref:F-actin-capping protein subunit alpha n=1 Tax=Camellia lanceoleosa TaxID=1840588 RepID=A0ACC0J4E0_9ERIC|nr:F-actin-capping protein subunit alpha [Camellia lanceoleosa]